VAADIKSQTPIFWRTVHQHPASLACPWHGIVTNRILVSNETNYYDAGDLAAENTEPSRKATALEMRVGLDLEWLIENGSNYTFGPDILGNALRHLLLRRLDFSGCDLALLRHIHAILNANLEHDEIASLSERNARGWEYGLSTIFRSVRPNPFFRYSLCLFSAGSSMCDLFEEAKAIKVFDASDVKVLHAKTEIRKYLSAPNNQCGRVYRALPNAWRLVRIADGGWLKNVLPYKKPCNNRDRTVNRSLCAALSIEMLDAAKRLQTKGEMKLPERLTIASIAR
jgi:hypothetical protein